MKQQQATLHQCGEDLPLYLDEGRGWRLVSWCVQEGDEAVAATLTPEGPKALGPAAPYVLACWEEVLP